MSERKSEKQIIPTRDQLRADIAERAERRFVEESRGEKPGRLSD